jgi:DNA polymerase II large subunit
LSLGLLSELKQQEHMDKNKKRGITVQKVIELYREDGVEMTMRQAEKILEFSKILVNIVVKQCVAETFSADAATK